MKLVFSKIENNDIFEAEFSDLSSENGTIKFHRNGNKGGLAVIYAPNGIGKTSLADVLNTIESTSKISFQATDENGQVLNSQTNSFHVIFDQVKRNIIIGQSSDYLIGENIRREYELKENIRTGFENTFKNSLGDLLKNKYCVNKITGILIDEVEKIDGKASEFLRSIANRNKRGKDIDQKEFIKYISDSTTAAKYDIMADDNEKFRFLVNDCANGEIIKTLREIDFNLFVAPKEALLVEQHGDAVTLLKRYPDVDRCIVCDNDKFDGERLLKQKQQAESDIYKSLDDRTKDLIDKIIRDSTLRDEKDPYGIRSIVKTFISDGNPEYLLSLLNEINKDIQSISRSIIHEIIHCFDGTNMLEEFYEFERLKERTPELETEELLFIQEIISDNIGRRIHVERDNQDGVIKLMIDNDELPGLSREDIHLSNGEQNFISLAFEMLFARHCEQEYVVLDDPMSSFDSIYKNKIAFCILKFLDNKRQIVLTHNTELIHLLNIQHHNCFNLYLLNNSSGASNGFIAVSSLEQRLLVNLYELIALLSNKTNVLERIVADKRLFLMSMIPFLRGYAHIVCNQGTVYSDLSQIMHGYNNASVNMTSIYKSLLAYDFAEDIIISSNEIISLDCDNISIICDENYHLFESALRHTLIYFHLRMKTEYVLSNTFNIKVGKDELSLGQIISRSFACENDDELFERKRADKIFFTSRKTLLNEFNHFEGNINIFQPAIDISQEKLNEEMISIQDRLNEIQEIYKR